MELAQWLSVKNIILFLLILFRVTGLMLVAPFFSQMGIPPMVKVWVSVTFTLIFFPLHVLSGTPLPLPENLPQFSALAVQELAIGFLIGFAADLLFTGIRIAGEYLGMQMGLSVSSILDPASGNQVPLLSQFYFILAIVLFLTFNFHHGLLLSLNHSFDLLPIGAPIQHVGTLVERFMVLAGEMFVVGLLLGLPVLGLLFAAEIATAFVAKVMPQMNVFMVAMPVKVALGLMAIAMTLPYTAQFLVEKFETLMEHTYILFKL